MWEIGACVGLNLHKDSEGFTERRSARGVNVLIP